MRGKRPLNLRDFPEGQSRRIKEIAAIRHTSMKQFIINVLQEEVVKHDQIQYKADIPISKAKETSEV